MATLTIAVTPAEQARVEQFLKFERMDNAGKIAEQARLQAEARARRVAAMSPAQRATYEARMTESTAKAAAERERMAQLPREQIEAERALRQKASAEARLARLPAKTVQDATAFLAAVAAAKED